MQPSGSHFSHSQKKTEQQSWLNYHHQSDIGMNAYFQLGLMKMTQFDFIATPVGFSTSYQGQFDVAAFQFVLDIQVITAIHNETD